MKSTLVISGFPGIGKSYAQKHSRGIVLDSDSSLFSWLRNADGSIQIDANGVKLRHPEFPNNYMQHIRENIGKADVIYVSSHDNVRHALNQANIKHALVYPSRNMKAEMIKRYIDRGSPQSFIDLMRNNWDSFLIGMKNDPCPNKIELKPGQYLSDVLETVKQLFKIIKERR